MIGIFRYDDDGRLDEEWVQSDYRSLLIKLGAATVMNVTAIDQDGVRGARE